MRYAGAAVASTVIVEIAAAVAVAHVISWPLTVLALLGLSLVGVELLRREGWAAFRRSRTQSPQQQIGVVAAGLSAAVLVAVPGFVSGAIGLVGLTPPGRALTQRLLAGRLAARSTRNAPHPGRTQDPRVVDGSLADDGPVDLSKAPRRYDES